MTVLTNETREKIAVLRERYPQARSAVLPSLWAAQEQLGYINADVMAEVAALLSLNPTEVQAVATFYSMYFDKPQGKHFVLVCENVSCALRGSDAIVAHCEDRFGPSGSTSADGVFTWQKTVECLGACGGAPAMQIDHHFYENLTPETLDAVFDAAAQQLTHTTESALPKQQRPTDL